MSTGTEAVEVSYFVNLHVVTGAHVWVGYWDAERAKKTEHASDSELCGRAIAMLKSMFPDAAHAVLCVP